MGRQSFTKAPSRSVPMVSTWMGITPLRQARSFQSVETHGGCCMTPDSSHTSTSLATSILTLESMTVVARSFHSNPQRMVKVELLADVVERDQFISSVLLSRVST